MSDGWITMPLSALGFALQLAEARQRPHTEWIEVDVDEPLDLDLSGEVSVQMFITEIARDLCPQEIPR